MWRQDGLDWVGETRLGADAPQALRGKHMATTMTIQSPLFKQRNKHLSLRYLAQLSHTHTNTHTAD